LPPSFPEEDDDEAAAGPSLWPDEAPLPFPSDDDDTDCSRRRASDSLLPPPPALRDGWDPREKLESFDGMDE
jgi:hypothetical protein